MFVIRRPSARKLSTRAAFLAILVSLVLTLVASATAADPGPYEGTTSQGRYVRLNVNDSGDSLNQFHFVFDLPCLKSKRVFLAGLGVYVNIPIVHQRFHYVLQTLQFSVEVSGKFTPSGAVGKVSTTWAALTPRGGLEKCMLTDVEWTATRVPAASGAELEGVDQLVEVREDESGEAIVTVASGD